MHRSNDRRTALAHKTIRVMENHMHILVPFTFASILFVSACAGAPQDRVQALESVASPETGLVQHYRCESGETIAASYPSTDSATVQYKGGVYNMRIAVSGSGSRYVGGAFEWWTKGSGPGSTGALFRHRADGTTAGSIEVCTAS